MIIKTLVHGLDAFGEYLCGISGEELFDFGIDNDIIKQVYISCNGYIYSKKGANLHDCYNMCG